MQNLDSKIWQESRDNTRKFFIEKQKAGLDLNSTPWVTLAPGLELQQLLIKGTIKEGMRVLDIGCSIGVEACFLAKHGLKVTGIDYIPETIDVGKKYAKLTDAKVDFICADFIEFNTDNLEGQFDLIIDQGCFHHMPIAEREIYAKKVSQLLSEGGLFFLRSFSDKMLPSPTGDGPIRLSSDDIYNTFNPYFITEHLHRFNNIPLPEPCAYKPQLFWSYLGTKRESSKK